MKDELLTKSQLGQTDLRISRLGLGTVKFGRNLGVKYPQQFSLPSDNEAKNLLSLASEMGINLIDTAPAYGTSEERLGMLLKTQRDKWIICSKAGEDFIDGESHYDFSPAQIRASVERSLSRLKTNFIDIVLLHSDGNDLAVIEQGGLDTLADLKHEGLIRAYGMSTKTVEGGLAAAKHADCVMVTYNLNERSELPVIDFCAAENKGVLLKKILASGHITQSASTNNNKAKITVPATNIAAQQSLQEKLNQQDPLQESMDFVFGHPGVSAAIVGTINPSHLKDNIAAAIKSIKK